MASANRRRFVRGLAGLAGAIGLGRIFGNGAARGSDRLAAAQALPETGLPRALAPPAGFHLVDGWLLTGADLVALGLDPAAMPCGAGLRL